MPTGTQTQTTGTTGPGTFTDPNIQTANANMPVWADQLQQQIGGAASGALTQLQQAPWYSGPLQAGLTPEQQQLVQRSMTTGGQWQPYFQQGQNMLNSGFTAAQNAPTWNAAEMQKHLNPYLSGVNDEIARRGNINFQQQLRELNPAFIGGGAFGSSRWQQANADLAGANQRDILGTQATAMNQAYDQAAKDYLGWGSLETQNTQNQINAGKAMFDAGTAAQGNAWNDISNPYKMQEMYRSNTQEGLDKAKADWLEQLKFPTRQLGVLSQIAQQATSPYSRNATQMNTTNPAAQPDWMSDLGTILAAIFGKG